MKTVLKFVGLAAIVVVLGGASFLAFSPGLRSDPTIGLSPTTHNLAEINVRDFTSATLRAEVKVYLPISAIEAMTIVTDFSTYPEWVSPAPETVTVDNSTGPNGTFGAGSVISYSAGQFDTIELLDTDRAMIARPQWGLDDFTDHRGVVLVTEAEGGSIIHMRRYFEPKSAKGWLMSRMMPRFMEQSAKNLALAYNGEVL